MTAIIAPSDLEVAIQWYTRLLVEDTKPFNESVHEADRRLLDLSNHWHEEGTLDWSAEEFAAEVKKVALARLFPGLPEDLRL